MSDEKPIPKPTPAAAIYASLYAELGNAIRRRDLGASFWDVPHSPYDKPSELWGRSQVELEAHVAQLADAIRALAVAGDAACRGGVAL